MNNEVLKSFIREYGDRICWIQLNNGYKIFIGYRDTDKLKSVNDIVYKTVNGSDWYGIPQYSYEYGDDMIGIAWHLTELVETFFVMDEKYADMRIDPKRTA